ncbi:MAG: hypothetical protein DRO40_11805 [Thermoprotei archaeon]|nr:MAG: hypothetical protein DRO40_11805 [Thermoprotei archaeon]
MSTTVLSIRIRRDLKEKMEKYKNINWREEIEQFIETKIRELEKHAILDEIKELLKDLPLSTVPAWKLIREDRENR